MFTNPFNRKYQTGGSAPTDDQKKEMQGFVTWIKSNVEGFKDKSEQEIAKSLSDMAKSEEGKKSVQDLYSRYQKSKKQKSKFADGGKFQDFICKHGRGGDIGCGCNGGKVIRGEDGLTDIDPNSREARKAKRTAKNTDDLNGVTRRSTSYIETPEGKWGFEEGNVNGNTTETYFFAPNGSVQTQVDTPWVQKIYTPYGYRIVRGNQNSARWTTLGPRIENILSQEDGGVLKGQDGLVTNLNRTDRNNRAKRWTRREALDVAQAGNEDAPSRGTLRKEYRQLKREGLENGLGWRARRDDARRRLVGGYNLNGEFQSTTPELVLPSFEGPRKYTEGVITTEGPTVTEVIATKRSPRTITPIPQQEGPSITDSLAAQKAFNDAWMQYQYERGIYNNRTGAYTAGQDGQAYMNWMYGDFKKNYDMGLFFLVLLKHVVNTVLIWIIIVSLLQKQCSFKQIPMNFLLNNVEM